MIYLLIVEDDKVRIIESELHVVDKYNFFPSEENTPITFETLEEAQEWVEEFVKPEYKDIVKPLLTFEDVRAKYLKV